MSEVAGMITAIIEWAKSSIKIPLIIMLLSGFGLFAPFRWQQHMQVNGFVAQHLAWFWGVFSAASLYVLLTFGGWLYGSAVGRYETGRMERDRERVYKSLAEDEMAVLSVFAWSGHTFRLLDEHNGVLQSLVDKGILYNSTNGDAWNWVHEYSLTSEANAYIRQPDVRTRLLAIASSLSQPR